MHEHSDSPEYQFNGNKDAIIFDVTGLPTGVVYNPETGFLSGVLESSGLIDFSITVEGEEIYAEQEFTSTLTTINHFHQSKCCITISCALAIIYLKKIPL